MVRSTVVIVSCQGMGSHRPRIERRPIHRQSWSLSSWKGEWTIWTRTGNIWSDELSFIFIILSGRPPPALSLPKRHGSYGTSKVERGFLASISSRTPLFRRSGTPHPLPALPDLAIDSTVAHHSRHQRTQHDFPARPPMASTDHPLHSLAPRIHPPAQAMSPNVSRITHW